MMMMMVEVLYGDIDVCGYTDDDRFDEDMLRIFAFVLIKFLHQYSILIVFIPPVSNDKIGRFTSHIHTPRAQLLLLLLLLL